MHLQALIKKIPLPHLILTEIAVGLLANLGAFFVFVSLTQNILQKETVLYDHFISEIIYSFRTPLLTTAMKTVTTIGNMPIGLLLSVLVIALLLIKKHKTELVIFASSLIAGSFLNFLMKLIFRRSRPQLSPLMTPKDFSYPSGHAMDNTILYVLLVFLFFRFTRNKKLSLIFGILSAFWVGLIGFSRVYLGVHYPSDIIGGFLAGFWVIVTALLIDKTISLRRQHEEKPH